MKVCVCYLAGVETNCFSFHTVCRDHKVKFLSLLKKKLSKINMATPPLSHQVLENINYQIYSFLIGWFQLFHLNQLLSYSLIFS